MKRTGKTETIIRISRNVLKKSLILGLCIILLSGCGSGSQDTGEDRSANQQTTVEDVLQAGVDASVEEKESSDDVPADQASQAGSEAVSSQASGAVPDAAAQDQEAASADSSLSAEMEEEEIQEADPSVDIDLTALSGTMVYSEVYNMMMTPDDYLEKSVKMSGAFAVYHDDETEKDYFACIIQDATACCAQGIEFVLDGDYVYPEDYPEIGEEITVKGIFETYKEGDSMYCTLVNAEML